MTTKISISLTDSTVATLDQFIAKHNLPSRSSAIQQAIAQLTATDLRNDYARAWQEWEDGADADAWDASAGDGIS